MLEKLTLLGKEDLMPNEEILLTELASWYAEIKSLIIAAISILVSVGLLIYFFINKFELFFYLLGGGYFPCRIILIYQSSL